MTAALVKCVARAPGPEHLETMPFQHKAKLESLEAVQAYLAAAKADQQAGPPSLHDMLASSDAPTGTASEEAHAAAAGRSSHHLLSGFAKNRGALDHLAEQLRRGRGRHATAPSDGAQTGRRSGSSVFDGGSNTATGRAGSKLIFEAACPEGHAAGDIIRVQTPNLVQYEVKIPPKIRAGAKFEVHVDATVTMDGCEFAAECRWL
eukprot:SAG22_NODE_3850_length_1502_cov_1.397719_1_plen_205_part_00